jgi:hypothetical protein
VTNPIKSRKVARFAALDREPWRIERWLELYRAGKWRRAQRVIDGQVCAARTRAGRSCIATPINPGGRCRHHGSLATGPRTVEGKARVAAAQRLHWARWCAERSAAKDQ